MAKILIHFIFAISLLVGKMNTSNMAKSQNTEENLLQAIIQPVIDFLNLILDKYSDLMATRNTTDGAENTTQEPDDTTFESDYTSPGTEISTQEPGNTTQASENTTQTPRNITQGSQNTTQTPRNTTQGSQNTTQAPRNTTQGSQNTTQRPAITTQGSQNTTQTPRNTTQDSQNTTQRPANTTQGSENTTQTPRNTTQGSQNTTQIPRNTTQGSQNTTQRPANTTQGSQNTTQTPRNTTQESQNSTQSSANTTRESQNTTQTPMNTTQGSQNTTQRPAITTQGSQNTTQTPRNTTQGSQNTTQSSANTTRGSQNTTQTPMNTTQGSQNTTQRPANTTQGSKNTTQTPRNTTQGSQNTTQTPRNTTQGLQNTTQRPENTTQGSENTTKTPRNTTQGSQNTTQTPTNTTQGTQNTTQRPANTTQGSQNTTQRPESGNTSQSENTTKVNTTGTTPVCGSSSSSCARSRYRSYDGTCNNLQNPLWGSAVEPFISLLNNTRPSNINFTAEGDLLPNPRAISLKIFIDRNLTDNTWSLNTMQWGQIIAHDMSVTASTTLISTTTPTCCDSNGKYTTEASTNKFCAAIPTPNNDVFNRADGIACIDFVRTVTTRDIGCTAPGARYFPLNENTAYMDVSLTYGVNETLAASLREGRGGRLLSEKRSGGVWMPQVSNATEFCSVILPANDTCYLAGDFRVNQNPQVTVLQTILLKEHNRIAGILSRLNKMWNDETIYQETRRIVIAIVQHINYYELLPILLGRNNMLEKKLIYNNPRKYINDYDSKINAGIINEHGTAAYRFFHTLIRGRLQLIKENRNLERTIRLSDWFNRPSVIEEKGAFDGLARGLTYQPQDRSDESFNIEITQYLFRDNRTNGLDLRAIDIQRGRDHAVASYVDVRAYCGLSVPKTFDDLIVNISRQNIESLKKLYKKVQDIDLVVGGAVERNVPGTLVGPTYLCVLLKQFYNTRVGDRFFYEMGIDKKLPSH